MTTTGTAADRRRQADNPPAGHRPRSGRQPAALLLALALLFLPAMVAGQESPEASPHKIEAAFLRNFAHYVTWPGHVFPDSRSPWHIGVLGRDPFGDVLDSTLKGRSVAGRSFTVFRGDSLDKLPPCQIIYIAHEQPALRRTALAELKDKPVLTVGDAPEFLREGGIIRFNVGDRVRMSINLDQAKAASLTIQTRMLEVSDDILENGTMRKRR